LLDNIDIASAVRQQDLLNKSFLPISQFFVLMSEMGMDFQDSDRKIIVQNYCLKNLKEIEYEAFLKDVEDLESGFILETQEILLNEKLKSKALYHC
jgi:hypothetical protein